MQGDPKIKSIYYFVTNTQKKMRFRMSQVSS